MRQAKSSLLVCGATFAGLGAAAAALETKRDVVVVERTASVGREFIEAFNPGSGREEPETELAQNLRDDWIRRGLQEGDGPVHLPGLHPVLCLLIRRYGLKVSFLTEIVEVAERNGQYEVLLVDASGYRRMQVDEIADTSSERLTTPGRLYVPRRKWIRAYLHHPAAGQTDLPAPFDGAMSVCRGRFPAEVMLKLSVDPQDDWREARQRLYRLWRNRPAEWSSWTIAATAGTFQSDVPPGPLQLGEAWRWLPSEAFSNPLTAIDRGCNLYRKAVDKCDAAKTSG